MKLFIGLLHRTKELTIELPSLSQQSLQVLYDHKFQVDLRKESADAVNDKVAAVIKTTHGQLSNIKKVLGNQNVTYVILSKWTYRTYPK